MIDGNVAIQIIESRLTNLIRQGQLNAKYNKSSKSISFYLRDIEVNSQPILTLRLSNHRPDFQGYIKNDFVLPSNTNNISIEFFKPRRSSSGRRKKDEMNANIEAETFKNITPFAITSYKYSPSNLEWADFEKIYQAIFNYLQTKTYNDPMIGSSKYANQKTKIATSKRSKYAVPQNISYRNGEFPEAATILTNGADDVPESIQRYRNNNIKLQYNMKKNRIRLTESYLHNIIKEVLNENWMTFMNAARGRKAQADAIRAEREKTFPHSQFASERNEYDDLADELEKHAQHTFQKQHGKNGKPYQYDGESSDYLGRNDYREDDWDYETKHNSGDKYWNGEEADRIGHYRYGNGFPYLKHGELHDDTFDFADGGKEGWSGNQKRKHTMIYDKDGERYSPDFSSVGNEVSKSKDKDYNNAMNNMAKEMNAYYTGKAKYQKGKGWSLDEAIRRAIRQALR